MMDAKALGIWMKNVACTLRAMRELITHLNTRMDTMNANIDGLTAAVGRLETELAADIAGHSGPSPQQPEIDALTARVAAAADELHAANNPPAVAATP